MTAPAASDPEILFESPRLRAKFRSGGGSSRLVITFDSWADDCSLDRSGFGEAWFTAVGYDAVHVIPSGNDWYQYDETFAALEAVARRAAAYDEAIAYGSSMGGYAAIRFARRAGARRAIAFSPQFSIDPARVPFEQRWKQDASRISFRLEDIRPEDADLDRAYLFYDPADSDRLHAALFAEHFPVQALRLWHSGHPAIGYLAETGLLAEAILAILDGTFDPDRFLRHARASRSRSAQYFSTLSREQPPSRRNLAIRLAEKAVELRPENPVYLVKLAMLMEGSARDAEAQALYRRAMAMTPDLPEVSYRYARYCFERNLLEDAETAALELSKAASARATVRSQNSRILLACGNWDAALSEARAAARLDPNGILYRLWPLLLAGARRLPGSRNLVARIYDHFSAT